MIFTTTKRLIILVLVFFLFSIQRSKSQVVPTIGIISEYTIIGDFTGVYGGIVINDRFNAGLFYEGGLFRSQSEFNPPSEMIGSYLNWVYLRDSKLRAAILFRAGVKDSQFLFIVPDATFALKLNDKFQIMALMGIRAEFPAIGIGVSYFIKKSGQHDK